ncbi:MULTISPECIES: hypothetical protein [Burkholderia]|nr:MULTISPECIES: hypothetical protein [Burkholderia]MDC6132586.1 hypothetical protein [Burkholderia gladioli]MDN7736632.1 hypothetical protein [Burkholderia gladioli]MDN7804676.1 hypothetical protein [Burkholderia gladioli]MDN7921118.1 hypothetical protein [Burkholderia gladioli]MDN8058935.1 hypothetical protein [Burkholderia gladioli]
MSTLHGVLARVLLAAICQHGGAAVLRRFVPRDGLLQRMLPW